VNWNGFISPVTLCDVCDVMVEHIKLLKSVGMFHVENDEYVRHERGGSTREGGNPRLPKLPTNSHLLLPCLVVNAIAEVFTE